MFVNIKCKVCSGNCSLLVTLPKRLFMKDLKYWSKESLNMNLFEHLWGIYNGANWKKNLSKALLCEIWENFFQKTNNKILIFFNNKENVKRSSCISKSKRRVNQILSDYIIR